MTEDPRIESIRQAKKKLDDLKKTEHKVREQIRLLQIERDSLCAERQLADVAYWALLNKLGDSL